MEQNRLRLSGKVAIVTGAGSSGPGFGTGKATSILFAREGAKVLLVDLVASRAEETLAIIEEEGGEASVFEADVTRSDDCRAMVDATLERYGAPSILFNNAAVNAVRGDTVADLEEDEWDRVLGVNLKGVMLTSGHTVPAMIEGGGGSIINVSSTAGIRAGGEVSYAAAKGGIVSLTYSMAAHHGRDNIRGKLPGPGTPLDSHGFGGRQQSGRYTHDRGKSRTPPKGRRPGHRGPPHGTLPGRWFSWQATRPAGFQARSCRWTPEHRPCCRSKCSD